MSARSHIDYRRASFVSVLLASLFVAAPAMGGDNALSVEAGLDYCGLSGEQVMCKVDVSHDRVEGAESYEVLVRAPDGSAVASGALPAGGASLWIPYAGDGIYSVTVSALGEPRGVDRPKELVAEEKADLAEADDDRAAGQSEPEVGEQGDVPPGSDQAEPPAVPEQPAVDDAPEPAAPPTADEQQAVDELQTGEPLPDEPPEAATGKRPGD